MIDNVTIPRIQILHPKVREEVMEIYSEIEQHVHPVICRFTQTLRTINDQNALYAKGRTAPGPIVTKARGGLSYHNYGLAIDIAFIKGGKLSYDMAADDDKDGRRDWMEVVEIFKSFGWAWGGNWATFKDYPHFEKSFGFTVRELLAKYNAGQVDEKGYVTI